MSEDAGRSSEYHDVEDVEEAIEALSDAAHLRLHRIALVRAQVLGYHPRQVSGDLLQEALTRTVAGRRRWRKGIDFIYHLDQAMKSIADSWRKRQTASSLSGEPEATVALSERQFEPEEEWLLRDELGPDRTLMGKERLKLIRTAFSEDAEAAEVIEGWAMGLKGSEIQEISGMSKKAYDAAVRRIRYRLPRLELDDGV